MKKTTLFILKKYSLMSGDKKVRLEMSLSRMAREIRKAGAIQTGA